MKIFITSVFIIIFFSSIVNSTIWRVNKDPAADADFTEVQDAHNAAQNGDTILVEGNSTIYSNVTSYKRLYLYGPGYFLDENPETQAITLTAKINIINFDPGSDGSVLSGFYITSEIEINTSNITIRRNKIRQMNTAGSLSSNIIIEQNYCEANLSGGNLIYCHNSIVRNNLIYNTYSSVRNAITCYSSFVYNNVIRGNMGPYDCIINNNILIEGNFDDWIYQGKNNQVNNNISNSDQFGTENGNQANVLMVTVFVGPTGNSTDGQWLLQPGSPAISAGKWGVDCGIFGGNTPYVLSGMPDIPAIFFLHTSGIGTTGNGLEVDLKAKTHD